LTQMHKIMLLAGALAALVTFGCSEETKPAAPAAASAASAPATAGTWDLWVSQTTKNEYRVRQDADRFTAEWTNMSGALLAHGGYIRSECKRQGTKWVGESHSHLPCAADNLPAGQYTNWCDLVTKIEFDEITPSRISGYGEGVKRIDCQKCLLLETSWKPFVWVPKR
jgi:hypothetical protein